MLAAHRARSSTSTRCARRTPLTQAAERELGIGGDSRRQRESGLHHDHPHDHYDDSVDRHDCSQNTIAWDFSGTRQSACRSAGLSARRWPLVAYDDGSATGALFYSCI